EAVDITPRAVLVGAEAAPGYYLSKMTIELINNVSRVISSDSAVESKLAVHMLPNYNVEIAQNLIPATGI
ncbi:glycogen/starch/alpha-glucan phosphorylase, partial [Bifidobacterium breve]|uniref:glycogen/starch/alpha-glucan phosphorylase n=1 Tax=Bifidobacterium breve TaxID=1685 RepID=UPI001D00DCAE